MKHSPSPWTLIGRGTIESADGAVIAEVTRGTAVPNDANACLIAAAPDLLEALKLAEDWLIPVAEQNREAQDLAVTLFTDGRMARIRAAVAKADGKV